MAQSVLSGLEISQAVERQKEYEKLFAQDRLYGLSDTPYKMGGLGFFQYLRMKRLARQPRIHIDGFDHQRTYEGGSLGTNSYDLRLANVLKVYKFGCMSDRGPERNPKFLDMRKPTPTEDLIIPPDGILLEPHTLYLGCTVEHTESYHLVPYIDGRSSVGRLGMVVHLTAGAGDRGFKGRFTLEITVVHPLKVYANEKICQIRYHTIGPGWNYRGRYQDAPAEPVASLLYK